MSEPKSVTYCMDCMEAMRKMPDKCFDLAVVDPPYGIGRDWQKGSNSKNSRRSRQTYESHGWDSQIPSAEYFKQLERVSENQIIWGGNYFIRHLKQGHKGWIVWDKGLRELTMSDCELAYSSFDKPTRIVMVNRFEIQRDGPMHPTQKPVKLYAWIFQRYANKGDKILDTHLGSGSSRIAAWNAGLDFVGFEIDPDYFEKQEQRFREHSAQINLFHGLDEP